MVRDLIIDIKEHDLLLDDKSNIAEPVFDAVWGNLFDSDAKNDMLICNIIIPEAYWTTVKYDDNEELLLKFKSPYKPEVKYFSVRPVKVKNKQYELFDTINNDPSLPVKSYALTKNIASQLYACQLPIISINGEFTIRLIKNKDGKLSDKAYIYSSEQSDLDVNYSDNQSAQLLSLCAPGKSYRYPITGVGITNYLNSVVEHTDMQDVLEAQFMDDGRPITSAYFDNNTGELETVYIPEKEKSDENLTDVDKLDKDFFDLFTDDYIRKDIVLDELSDTDFNKLLADYDKIMGIMIFLDDSTTAKHIVDGMTDGRFDSDGNIVEDEEYCIVSATLEANTIIMFDDEEEDSIKDAPVFIVDDSKENGVRLYTALVEQPYWIADSCHKCMILQKRASVKYMIRKSSFLEQNKGLFVIPQTSANIKNMCAIVQDENTGRLLGVVSNRTNINDFVLDEIMQYLYVSKNN